MCLRLGKDPYSLRVEMLQEAPRHLAVLNKLAEISNWKVDPDPGIYRGLACINHLGP